MTRASKATTLFALTMLVAGLALAPVLGNSIDEEYTLATTAHGPAYAWSRAITYELQAPLYFTLEAAWRLFDERDLWFARLPSVFAYVGFIYALGALARRIAPGREPLPFVALVALNPFVLEAARNVRPYILALFVSALLWIAFYDGYLRKDRRTSARVAFVVLAIVGTYVHYFFAFGVVAAVVALTLSAGIGRGMRLAFECIPAALAIAPFALVLRRQAAPMLDPPHVSLWKHLLSIAITPSLNLLFPFEGIVPDHYSPAGLTLFALCAAVIAILVVAGPRPDPSTRPWLFAVGTIALLYAGLATALDARLSERYFFALCVPVAAAAYAYFWRILEQRPRLAFGYVLTPLFTVAALAQQGPSLVLGGDWRGIAGYVSAGLAPGDAVSLYPAESEAAFERWFEGRAPVVPFPRTMPAGTFTLEGLSPTSDDDAAAALQTLRGHPRVWFVDAVECLPRDPERGCDHVAAALRRLVVPVTTRDFGNTRVTLFAWKSP